MTVIQPLACGFNVEEDLLVYTVLCQCGAAHVYHVPINEKPLRLIHTAPDLDYGSCKDCAGLVEYGCV